MMRWEKEFRRTAVAALGVILLSGSAGVSAQAGETTPPVNTESSENSATQGVDGKTTIRSVDVSGDWSYQQVPVGTKEADLYSRFPNELQVKAVVEQGIAPDASGVTVLRIVSDLTQTYTSTDTKDITVDVERWSVDTSIEGCTGSNFDSSRDGNVYFYRPVLKDTDREGNTLHWNKADLPYITVLVGEGVMPMADADSTPGAADPDTPPSVVQSREAHGLRIATETQDDMDDNVELLQARSCFRLKNGGSFTVLGQWKEVTDNKGNEVAPNTDPMITIIGAAKAPSKPEDLPKFTIYFGDSNGVSITPAKKFGLINKPIIKVQGFCEVELVVAENTIFTCSKEVPALDVPAGSSVRIRGGSGKTFDFDGNIRNLGTVTIQGMDADLEVKGKIENKGSFRVASKESLKSLGGITNEGEMILEEEGLLDGSGTFVNFGKAKLELGEKSTLKTGTFTNEGEVNIPRSVKVQTVGGGDFENNGKLRIGADSDVPGGTEDPGKANLIVSGSMTNNSQDMKIDKQGNVEVQRNFTNAGKVVVSSWTLPVSGIIRPTAKDGGTLLVGKEGSPEVRNNGRIEIGEGGLLTSDMSGCKVINSGELSLASVETVGTVPGCLGSNIKLEKGMNGTTGEESGEFYLTDITSGMVIPMEDIAYDGQNHYNTLFQKCAYKKLYNEEPNIEEDPAATWDLPQYEGITFQVTPAQGWGVDLYNNSKGEGSVNKSVRFSSKGDENGNYYVVYKNVNRRKDPAFQKFHMSPATLSIDVNGTGKEIPKDHPDYNTVFNWPLDEEVVRKGYSLGENMEIRVNLAIETRIGKQGIEGKSLKVTVKEQKDPTHYLTDTGRKELNNAEYTLSFDNLGIATETIKISTLFNGAPIQAGVYEVEIQYDEPALDNVDKIQVDNEEFEVKDAVKKDVSTILHPTKANELYVLRTFPEIDISRYSKDYTYGDEIPNPDIDAATAIIRNYYGNAPLECEWYKTDDLEQVKAENDAIKEEIRTLWTDGKKDEALALKTKKAEHFVGTQFPTKEFLENNGEYEGVVAGDYVLRVMLGDDYDDSKFSTYSAPGEIYQRIHVNTKLATLRISMDPGPSKVYGEPDEPIEYEAEGLVGDDVLNGQLGRARDRDNVDSTGNQGEDKYDKVGSYLINTGTINTNLNKNYEIVLASPNYQFQIVPKDLNWNTQNLIVAQQDNRYKVYGGLTLRGLEDKDKGYVGVTYDNLVVSEDGKSLEVTNPKVIDIYGNEETKYASNYNPPRSNTIPIDETIYRLSVSEGSITHLSDALKAANQTTDGITKRMTAEVKTLRNNKLGYKSDGEYRLYDVKVVTDSGETVEDIFQKGGLMVTIPYPEGTSKSTHNFVALHMISSEIAGAPKPTSLEKYSGSGGTEPNGEAFYKIEKTDEGLVIKVTGLSPVAVAWAPISNTPTDPDDPNNPDDPNGGNNSGNNNNNNGTNSGNNNSNNGTNSGNNNSSNGTNSGNNNNSSNNNGTGTNNGSSSTTNKNGSTTRTSGVATGDTAPILFYSLSALAAVLLLIFIICMIRKRRKEE